MSERKERYNAKLIKVGELLKKNREAFKKGSRKAFIDERADFFGGEEWISERYLSSLEEGKNLPSIDMLITLARALDVEPELLFLDIYRILCDIPSPETSESQEYKGQKLKKVGTLLLEKRHMFSKATRAQFIENRAEYFDDENWITEEYLSSLEEGRVLPSVDVLIKLAQAVDVDPIRLFEEVYKILCDAQDVYS